MIEAPITYLPGFMDATTANAYFETLKSELSWIRHDKTPRSEYYVNDYLKPYTYGTPPYDRTYQAQPITLAISALRAMAEKAAGCSFEVGFLNLYHDQSDHLGWHADDSPEMDSNRPIAIVSLGVEREIWFRKNPGDGKCTACNGSGYYDGAGGHYCGCCGGSGKSQAPLVQKVSLGNGSLCIMNAGMQETHQHRIPKAGFMCGERISLTFRGYVENKLATNTAT